MKETFIRRKKRVRSKIVSSKDRLRLSVFRSNRALYAQVIDDIKEETVLSYSSKKVTGKEMKGKTKTDIASEMGKNLAAECKKKKIAKLVLDRSGYRYHGRIKALADGLREGGIEI